MLYSYVDWFLDLYSIDTTIIILAIAFVLCTGYCMLLMFVPRTVADGYRPQYSFVEKQVKTVKRLKQIVEQSAAETRSIRILGTGWSWSHITWPNKGGISLKLKGCFENTITVNEDKTQVRVGAGVTAWKLLTYLSDQDRQLDASGYCITTERSQTAGGLVADDVHHTGIKSFNHIALSVELMTVNERGQATIVTARRGTAQFQAVFNGAGETGIIMFVTFEIVPVTYYNVVKEEVTPLKASQTGVEYLEKILRHYAALGSTRMPVGKSARRYKIDYKANKVIHIWQERVENYSSGDVKCAIGMDPSLYSGRRGGWLLALPFILMVRCISPVLAMNLHDSIATQIKKSRLLYEAHAWSIRRAYHNTLGRWLLSGGDRTLCSKKPLYTFGRMMTGIAAFSNYAHHYSEIEIQVPVSAAVGIFNIFHKILVPHCFNIWFRVIPQRSALINGWNEDIVVIQFYTGLTHNPEFNKAYAQAFKKASQMFPGQLGVHRGKMNKVGDEAYRSGQDPSRLAIFDSICRQNDPHKLFAKKQ